MARDRALSFGSSYRRKRFALIKRMIDDIVSRKGSCSIIDVGGEYDYWKPFLPELADTPIKVLMCNLDDRSIAFDDPRFSARYTNACDLGFATDMSYDLAHSNSVIEHVGRWPEMLAMAKEIRRVAPSYYVQTPYYWFPMEPHFRTIGYQWLPEQWRARLHTRFELGYFSRAENFETGMHWTQHAVLLDKLQMTTLFPDAKLHSERDFGLTKSMVMIRDGVGAQPAGVAS